MNATVKSNSLGVCLKSKHEQNTPLCRPILLSLVSSGIVFLCVVDGESR